MHAMLIGIGERMTKELTAQSIDAATAGGYDDAFGINNKKEMKRQAKT